MPNPKYTTLFILFLSLFLITNLHAQSKIVKGTVAIGIGKTIKNSKTLKDTKEFTKQTLKTDLTSNDIDNSNKENDDSNFLTSSLLNTKDNLLKNNQKSIDSIANSAQGIKDTGESIGNIFSKISNSVSNGTGSNKNKNNKSDKPSLKKLSNKEAEKVVQKHGYKNAHAFKKEIAGKENISKYDIKINSKTGEIFLEGVKNEKQMPTGLFR